MGARIDGRPHWIQPLRRRVQLGDTLFGVASHALSLMGPRPAFSCRHRRRRPRQRYPEVAPPDDLCQVRPASEPGAG